MCEEIGNSVQAMTQSESPAKNILRHTETFFKILFKNKFLMIEFVFFMRNYNVISEHFNQLMIQRKQEFVGLFSLLRSIGFMNDELIPGQDEALLDTILLVGNFWISQEVIHSPMQDNRVAVARGVRTMFHLILPYFTPRAAEEFGKELELLFPK